MQLISHGAAREVTGSCHELRIGNKRILLDCGLFQGSRKKSAEKNATFAFDPATEIDAVILTHAHMDHVGRIPVLWKKGYRGPVFSTYATKDLAEVMLLDGGYIQEKDEEYFCKHLKDSMMPCEGPLYTQKDATACHALFRGQNYGEWFEVVEGVKAQFLEAGHVLGAAMVVLEVTARHADSLNVMLSEATSPEFVEGRGAESKHVALTSNITSLRDASTSPVPSEAERSRGAQHDVSNISSFRIGFTGDLGRDTLPIIRDPAEMPPVDVLLCESTYGNRTHEEIGTAKEHLRDVILRTAERGGKILIPAFSLERTQEIIYDLHILWNEKLIPEIPIVIDSPLASRVTKIFRAHPECYDNDMYERFLAKSHNPFQFRLVRFTESVEESKALNTTPGPMVIMAGSGMCEGGRIRHHLKTHLEDPRCTVLIVGYMAENTLGRRLVDPSVSAVKIFDELVQKRAKIVAINAYSGHADMRDLDAFIAAVVQKDSRLRSLFFVHGEEEGMAALAERTGKAFPQIKITRSERGVAYEL